MGRHALLIGIDDYQFAPLSSCVNDAAAMRDMLVKLDLFKENECTLMTSPQQAPGNSLPTRKAILQFLLNFYDAQRHLDRLAVFFAGHGLSVRLGRAADELRTAIVPAGVHRLRHSGDELIDLDELLGRFARRGAKEQYWIIDACRNVVENTVPNVSEIGWDRPAGDDVREAYEMAQAVLYAVAPLGQARAAKGGHGVVTGHLLDALACRGAAEWGAGGWYDEARNSWLFDLESLADYARRRIRPTLAKGSWQAQYLLPQCWKSEKGPSPLLEVNTIEDRPFGTFVTPPEAASALNISLKVRRNTVSSWPPRTNGEMVMLAPERYRLEARLADLATNWSPPHLPDPPVVDVRDVGRFDVVVQPRMEAQPGAPPPSDGAGPADLSIAPATGRVSLAITPKAPEFVPSADAHGGPETFRDGTGSRRRGRYKLGAPTLTVRTIDPGATVHLTRLTGGNDERVEHPNVPIGLSEGIWRIEIRIGKDVIGFYEDDFAAGEHYDIVATAQVTPALAALMPDPTGEANRAANHPRPDLIVSQAIGPMQGAILPTLLPLLALKPLDHENNILNSFAPLGIPRHEQRTSHPVAVALAFDGPWTQRDLRLRGAAASVYAAVSGQLIWRDGSMRTSLFMIDDPERDDLVAVTVPGMKTVSVGSPKVPNHCTTIAMTLWPDGRNDVSVSLFKLPPGSDQAVPPERLSRALTIATRLYGAGHRVDQVEYGVLSSIATDSFRDPVLSAIAWFARDGRLKSDRTLSPGRRKYLMERQASVCDFLRAAMPELADTLVTNAVSGPNPVAALDTLVDDPNFPQPVLADALSRLARHAFSRLQLQHWSVIRFQNLAPDAVFNVASAH
jgi:hypothetical protein